MGGGHIRVLWVTFISFLCLKWCQYKKCLFKKDVLSSTTSDSLTHMVQIFPPSCA